jgi:hypothetical protein
MGWEGVSMNDTVQPASRELDTVPATQVNVAIDRLVENSLVLYTPTNIAENALVSVGVAARRELNNRRKIIEEQLALITALETTVREEARQIVTEHTVNSQLEGRCRSELETITMYENVLYQIAHIVSGPTDHVDVQYLPDMVANALVSLADSRTYPDSQFDGAIVERARAHVRGSKAEPRRVVPFRPVDTAEATG